MNEPTNIREFQALVERYETITIEEIRDKWKTTNEPLRFGHFVAEKLTGFGSIYSCTLCMAVEFDLYSNSYSKSSDCDKCVYKSTGNYSMSAGCSKGDNHLTYTYISDANSPEELLAAFRNRAEHLRSKYPQYLTK